MILRQDRTCSFLRQQSEAFMQACDMRVAVVTPWTKAVKYLMNKPKDQRFSAHTVTDADVPLSNAYYQQLWSICSQISNLVWAPDSRCSRRSSHNSAGIGVSLQTMDIIAIHRPAGSICVFKCCFFFTSSNYVSLTKTPELFHPISLVFYVYAGVDNKGNLI